MLKITIAYITKIAYVLVFLYLSTAVESGFALPYGSAKYGSCTYETCSITLTSAGSISLSIDPSGSGTYTIQKDEITVESGATTGYTVDLSASSSVTDLVNGGYDISRVSASYASPQVLSTNSWGYRLDDVGDFGSGPTSAVTSVASSSLVFAGVQPVTTPDTIIATNSESAVAGDAYDIWYGVKADSTLTSGVYSQTVTYTAVQKY